MGALLSISLPRLNHPSLCLGLVLGFIGGLGFGLFIAWIAFEHFILTPPQPSPTPSKVNPLAAALDPPFQPGSCTSNFVISIIKDSYVIPSWRKLLIFWRRKALLNYLIASKLSRRTTSFTSLVILQLELGLHFAWVFRSIDTNTPFECETPNCDFCVSHGVVLRSPYKVLRQALHGKGIFRTFWTG